MQLAGLPAPALLALISKEGDLPPVLGAYAVVGAAHWRRQSPEGKQFPWGGGRGALVEKALEAGLYFSVNSAMLRTKKGRALIGAIPGTVTNRDRRSVRQAGPAAGQSCCDYKDSRLRRVDLGRVSCRGAVCGLGELDDAL